MLVGSHKCTITNTQIHKYTNTSLLKSFLTTYRRVPKTRPRLVVSLQTFEEFFLSRLLTCPNFSFGSCRACRSAKEEEKSSEQKCGWQFQAIPSWQENIAPPPPAGSTSSCKMFNLGEIPSNFFLSKSLRN